MYYFAKRSFDIFVASVALMILSPLLAVVALACRFSGEGEVLYFQKRIGKGREYFYIWKFATMLKDSEKLGAGAITLRDDPRVTSVGKYLRISKINELPQIVNVLKGDMSIVGPRPLVDRTFLAYSEPIRELVSKSQPGITGIGSLVFRDEEKMISNSKLEPHEFYRLEIAPYKGRLEAWYYENKSLYTDSVIVLLTALTILFPRSSLVSRVFRDLPAS